MAALSCHMAALRVFSLLSQSQARSEKQLRSDNEEMISMLEDLNNENEELRTGLFGPTSPISPVNSTPNTEDNEPFDGPGCAKCYACVSGGSTSCQISD